MSILRFLSLGAVLCLAAGAARAAPGPTGASPHVALVRDLDLWRAAASALARAGGPAPAWEVMGASDASTDGASRPSSDGGVWVNPVLRGVGVGVQVGTPTSLTLKFAAPSNADVVVGVGAGFGYRGGLSVGLSIHADYLFTVATLMRSADLTLDAYVGPGLWLTLFDRGYGYIGGYYYVGIDFLGVGVRAPVGVSARFRSAPVEIYLELDPAIFVFPGMSGFVGGSLGFRWFF